MTNRRALTQKAHRQIVNELIALVSETASVTHFARHGVDVRDGDVPHNDDQRALVERAQTVYELVANARSELERAQFADAHLRPVAVTHLDAALLGC